MSDIPQPKVCVKNVSYDKSSNNIKSIIRNLVFLLKPMWKYGKLYIIFSIILSLIQPVSSILGICFQQTIIDSISEKKDFLDIMRILIFYGIILLIIPIINNVWAELYREKKSINIKAAISKDIYLKAIKTDYKYFDDPEFFNHYTWAITQYTVQIEAAYNLIVSFFSSVVGISALAAVIISNDALIIVLTLISLIVTSLIKMHISKINYMKVNEEMPHERKKEYINRTMYLKEYISGLKSTNIAKFLLRKYDDSIKKIISIINKYRVKIFVYENINESLGGLLYLLTVVYLSYKIIIGELTIGSFAAMITASTALKTYLNSFFSLINKSQEISVFSGKIRDFFKLESTIEGNSTKGKNAPSGPMSIELKNVNFAYNNSNFALKNINMKINKGEKIAIVGENGAGKTTLTKLLLRLYDPNSGEIYINDTPLSNYKIVELRKKIGISFQDSTLYALSVSENMSIYNEPDRETLVKIFNMFGLDTVLEKSNSDFDSEVTREFDNNGLILSGGEQQKFTLARLFTCEFGLMILDEPTSALDPIAEYELNKIIFNKSANTTTIMISHRLSTTRDADRIYLFNDGEIIESGTHDELMALSGRYYDMFTKQAENYISSYN